MAAKKRSSSNFIGLLLVFIIIIIAVLGFWFLILKPKLQGPNISGIILNAPESEQETAFFSWTAVSGYTYGYNLYTYVLSDDLMTSDSSTRTTIVTNGTTTTPRVDIPNAEDGHFYTLTVWLIDSEGIKGPETSNTGVVLYKPLLVNGTASMDTTNAMFFTGNYSHPFDTLVSLTMRVGSGTDPRQAITQTVPRSELVADVRAGTSSTSWRIGANPDSAIVDASRPIITQIIIQRHARLAIPGTNNDLLAQVDFTINFSPPVLITKARVVTETVTPQFQYSPGGNPGGQFMFNYP